MRLHLFDQPLPPDTGPRSIGAVKMLRLSLTDRCNYRCVYCMPVEGMKWLPKDQLLTDDEIAGVVAAATAFHGIGHFKLTGGEPTLRPGLVALVERLHATPGVRALSMTTNGQLLEKLAAPLYAAGLKRVTVSLDTLRPDRFARITRGGDLAAVLRGVDACVAAGMTNTKINVVTMRGVNDDEVADFARLTLTRHLTVRFIEYMPLGDAATADASAVASDETGPTGGCGTQARGDVLVSETETRAAIEREVGKLRLVDRSTEAGVGPAVPYALDGAAGRVAFISAMSAPFCTTCNRLRLTATGVLRSCLFDGGEVDLKPILRGANPGARSAAIARAMVDCVRLKPDNHSPRGLESMSRVGG